MQRRHVRLAPHHVAVQRDLGAGLVLLDVLPRDPALALARGARPEIDGDVVRTGHHFEIQLTIENAGTATAVVPADPAKGGKKIDKAVKKIARKWRKMLGGGMRQARRFALRFDDYARVAPFEAHIEVVAGVKRYVKEGRGG